MIMKNLALLLRKNIAFTLAIALLISSCSKDSSNLTDIDTNSVVPLKSEFALNLNKIIEGNQISFTELSEGEPTGWSWTFEGGIPATSTEKNPVITYSEQGAFKVSLTVSKDDDSETIEKENLIDVLALFDGNDVPETQLCKLDKIFTNDYVDLGFPNNGPSPSLGQVNIQILFVDFPDAVASQTTTSIFNLLESINTEFYEEMSYGKMEIKLLPYHSWLRLSMVSSQYAEALSSSSGHLSFIQEMSLRAMLIGKRRNRHSPPLPIHLYRYHWYFSGRIPLPFVLPHNIRPWHYRKHSSLKARHLADDQVPPFQLLRMFT